MDILVIQILLLETDRLATSILMKNFTALWYVWNLITWVVNMIRTGGRWKPHFLWLQDIFNRTP